MNTILKFSDLVNFNSEKFTTSQNHDRVQVTYKPKRAIIGEIGLTSDNEIVLFEEGGVHFSTKPVNTVADACFVLLQRKFNIKK